MTAGTAARSGARPPTLVTGFLLLALIRIQLRISGFPPSERWLRLLTGNARAAEASEPRETIAAVVKAVATAAAFFPGRALCLEQALATYVLLRRRGIRASLRLGVRPAPFSAHAWVEYAGAPIGENAEFIRNLVPLSAGLH